jgi:hypothetical protein
MFNFKYIPDQIYINGKLFGTFDQFKAYYKNINTVILQKDKFFELNGEIFEWINEHGHHVTPDENFKIKPYQQLYSEVLKYAPLANDVVLD